MRRLLAAIAISTLLAACESSLDVDGTDIDGAVGETGQTASCALEATLDGRTFIGNGGIVRIPDPGEPIGRAVIASCGTEPSFDIKARAIDGVDPELAWISPRYENTIFVADDIEDWPQELAAFREAPRCDGTDPIELDGPWLGILGPSNETEVDLVPPYTIDLRVDEASSPDLVGSFLTIHVEPELGEPITRQDIRSSLWRGGTIAVTATCRADGEFDAITLTPSPPR